MDNSKTKKYQQVYDRIVDNRILLGQDNDNNPAMQSSGCVFYDLNCPCQKQPDCGVCDGKI